MAKQAKKLTRAAKIANLEEQRRFERDAQQIGLSLNSAKRVICIAERRAPNSVIQAQSVSQMQAYLLTVVNRAVGVLESIASIERAIEAVRAEPYLSAEEEGEAPDHEGRLEVKRAEFDNYPPEIQVKAREIHDANVAATRLRWSEEEQAGKKPLINMVEEDMLDWLRDRRLELGITEPISEAGYCGEQYWIWEDAILKPVMEQLGFRHIYCYNAEADRFGPLIREVVAIKDDETGPRRWEFCYG